VNDTLVLQPRFLEAFAASFTCSTAHSCRAGVSLDGYWREGVKGLVRGGVYGHELALQVGRQFRDGEAVLRHRAGDLVAVGLGLRRLCQIEQACVPGRDLDTFVA